MLIRPYRYIKNIVTLSIIFLLLSINGLHILHDHEHENSTCQICFIYQNMDNDAIVLKIPKIEFPLTYIDLRYNFYSEYSGSTLSRAPPSSYFFT